MASRLVSLSLLLALYAGPSFPGIRIADNICDVLEGPPVSCVTILVEQWREEPALSCFCLDNLSEPLPFVNYPEEFFGVMAEHQDVFDGWVQGLAFHTFTVERVRGTTMATLEAALLDRLYDLMRETATQYATNERFGEMAKSMLGAIKKIEVTE